jgi:predicted regulator of Ras-like GTPase activity (Roadblock/LC7/MglB family)
MLTELVEAVPGANGAILADWEGEAVEQFTRGDAFEIKVTAAHWGILLYQLKGVQQKLFPGQVREALITTDQQHVIVGALGEDYALVMTMDQGALPLVALKNFRETAALLMKEIY